MTHPTPLPAVDADVAALVRRLKACAEECSPYPRYSQSIADFRNECTPANILALIDALTAAQARVEAVEWQPIETAPKDGSPIILGYAPDETYEDGFVAQGRWHKEDHDGPDNMGHDAGFMDDQFDFFKCARSFGNPKYMSAGLQPTHWRPLPPPPADTAIGGKGA